VNDLMNGAASEVLRLHDPEKEHDSDPVCPREYAVHSDTSGPENVI